jgi:hypothetical protein
LRLAATGGPAAATAAGSGCHGDDAAAAAARAAAGGGGGGGFGSSVDTLGAPGSIEAAGAQSAGETTASFFCRLLNLNITIILFTKTGSGQTWGKHNSKKTFYRFLAVAGEISAPFSNDAAPNRTEAAHTFQTAAAAEEEEEAAAEEDEICPVRSRLPNCVFSPFCLTSVPSLSWQNVWCPGPRASLSWQNGRVTSSSACSSLHYTLCIIYYIVDYCIITSSSACLECVRPFGMCVRIL